MGVLEWDRREGGVRWTGVVWMMAGAVAAAFCGRCCAWEWPGSLETWLCGRARVVCGARSAVRGRAGGYAMSGAAAGLSRDSLSGLRWVSDGMDGGGDERGAG